MIRKLAVILVLSVVLFFIFLWYFRLTGAGRLG